MSGTGGAMRKGKSLPAPTSKSQSVSAERERERDPDPNPVPDPNPQPQAADPKQPTEKRLSAVSPPGVESEMCKTFIFKKEGHTLGNALRSIISNYPDVEFCGYSLPHPSEDVMHFRIQSAGTPVLQILERGFDDLDKVCEEIETRFPIAMEEWELEQAAKKKAAIGLIKDARGAAATAADAMDLDLDDPS